MFKQCTNVYNPFFLGTPKKNVELERSEALNVDIEGDEDNLIQMEALSLQLL